MHVFYRLLSSVLPVIMFALAAFTPACAAAAEVKLRWDTPPQDSSPAGITGYNVYYGRNSRNYKYTAYTGNKTTYTVGDLAEGTWYFAVTSVDSWGNESEYSNEVRIGLKATTSPFLQSLSMDHGIEGTQVTVSGVNFGARKGAVHVGAKKARVVQWSPDGDSISFLSPKKLPYETYEVGVVTADKAKSGNTLLYQVMQANITGSSARSGAIGDHVTLTGEYFGPKPRVYCSLASGGKAKRKAARVTGYSVADDLSSTVDFTVPDLEPGGYVLTVVNSQGTSNGWNFEVK